MCVYVVCTVCENGGVCVCASRCVCMCTCVWDVCVWGVYIACEYVGMCVQVSKRDEARLRLPDFSG